MYDVNLRLPGKPNRYVITEALNVLAIANAVWFLEQFAEGLEPPCCCKCAGVKWDPDAVTAEFTSAPDVLRKGKASCGPIAAFDAGGEMAKLARKLGDFEAAVQQYGVELVEVEPYAVGGNGHLIGADIRNARGKVSHPYLGVQTGRPRRSSAAHEIGHLERRIPTYHAMVVTPKGLADPTAKMERVR